MTADYIAALPRKRMGAGALLTDGEGRALIVEPGYKDYWEIPGGVVEADESPHAAATREINEELGLQLSLGGVLVIDWVPPRPDRTEGLMMVFDGGTLTAEQTGQIRLQTDELRSWAWCTEKEAAQRLSDLLARRLGAALQAHKKGTTTYLENGHPIA
jgi:8-oxo-dGTP diphosphatase